MVEFDVKSHKYVPEHKVLTEEEKEEVLKKFNITLAQLPQIKKNDPSIIEQQLSTGDVVKIIRNSPTMGKVKYYRVVINA